MGLMSSSQVKPDDGKAIKALLATLNEINVGVVAYSTASFGLVECNRPAMIILLCPQIGPSHVNIMYWLVRRYFGRRFEHIICVSCDNPRAVTHVITVNGMVDRDAVADSNASLGVSSADPWVAKERTLQAKECTQPAKEHMLQAKEHMLQAKVEMDERPTKRARHRVKPSQSRLARQLSRKVARRMCVGCGLMQPEVDYSHDATGETDGMCILCRTRMGISQQPEY